MLQELSPCQRSCSGGRATTCSSSDHGALCLRGGCLPCFDTFAATICRMPDRTPLGKERHAAIRLSSSGSAARLNTLHCALQRSMETLLLCLQAVTSHAARLAQPVWIRQQTGWQGFGPGLSNACSIHTLWAEPSGLQDRRKAADAFQYGRSYLLPRHQPTYRTRRSLAGWLEDTGSRMFTSSVKGVPTRSGVYARRGLLVIR